MEGAFQHASNSPHVILTKVRTQGNERRLVWLWVLTFVRMTELVRNVLDRPGAFHPLSILPRQGEVAGISLTEGEE